MTIPSMAGLLACLAGGVCFYLASPHQRGLAVPWPARAARGAGCVLLLAGLLGLARGMQTLTAVFVWATALMLIFAVLPYLGALRTIGRDR